MDAASAKQLAVQLSGKTVGGWTLCESIGHGKSAVVFRAERDGNTAAVKVWDDELVNFYGREKQLVRIGRELGLRGKIHPNLVKILDGGECPETKWLFVVMEYLPHPNLAAVLRNVPRDRIWHIISGVARAARFLESQSPPIAHRDIKPQNIVVSYDWQQVTLLDLGVLHPVGQTNLTDQEAKRFIGTLQYSAPEYLNRKEDETVDAWQAITFYQLGAVLHDLLTKQPLFQEYAEPFVTLADAIREIVPTIDVTDVSAELVLLAKNCLVKDPQKRLQFVKWEDFEPRNPTPSTTLSTEDRIRKRVGVLQKVETELKETSTNRNSQQALSFLQDAVIATARRICFNGEFFPPVAVRTLTSEGDSSKFAILLADDDLFGPQRVLYFKLSLELLDAQDNAVRIQLVGGLCSLSQTIGHPAGFEDIQFERQHIVHEGVYQDGVIEEGLRSAFYAGFDYVLELRDTPDLRQTRFDWFIVTE